MIKRLLGGTIWAAKAVRAARSARAAALSLGRAAGRAAARTAMRIVTDTDTYVFGGIGLVGTGVGLAVSLPWALIVTGALLLAFGVWMALPLPGSPGSEDK